MIRLIIHDPVRPVYLFQQNHLHELMRKCHPGKAELIVCSGKYLLA